MELFWLLFAAGGIYASFLYYGSLLEDVLAYQAPDGTQFTYSWFLNLLEAAVNVVCGLVLMVATEGVRQVPQMPYVISGAVQVTAKYTTTAAMVAGVSFPVAVLAKSSKMVPVMLGSLLLGKASYSFREYLNVALVVSGTILVSMSKGKKSGAPTSMLGLALILGSLACDGVVAGVQKRFKKEMQVRGTKPKNFEMQFYTNLYMGLSAALFTFAFGEFAPGWAFCMANPDILQGIVKFALCSAVGQVFIFLTISRFDPLVCSTVTTTRKVFSVLLSIFFKGHQLDHIGWTGLSVACLGIVSELASKATAPAHGKAEDVKQKKAV